MPVIRFLQRPEWAWTDRCTVQSQITHTVKIEINCCACINLCVFEGCMNVTVGVNKTSVRLVRFIAVRR